MLIETRQGSERANMVPLAEYLMEKVLRMSDGKGRFADPEIEKEFQEWKREREAKGA